MSDATKTPGPTGPIASDMTAAPDAAKSQLVQPSAKKKVKIRALRAIAIDNLTLSPGSIAEVDEETAAEYCDRSFDGGYAFAGERGNSTADKFKIVRAERVA